MLFANGVWKEQGKVYLQLLKRGVCASESFSQRSWTCGTFVLYVYWSNVAVLTAISDHSLQNILVVGHTGIGQPVQRTWSKQRERAFLSGGDSLLSEYAACGWVSSWWHLVTREAVSCTYSCWTKKTNICSVALFTRPGRLDIPATVQHVFMVSSAKLSCVHFFFFNSGWHVIFFICLWSRGLLDVSFKSNSIALNRRQCCQPASSSLCWSGVASSGLEGWMVSAHTLLKPMLTLSKVVQVVVTPSERWYRGISGTIPKFSYFFRVVLN